jgi:hypothetical protein
VQSELTLHQIVDGISALVAVLTPDGAVEFVNQQVLDYFGKTLEELKRWASTDPFTPMTFPASSIYSSVHSRAGARTTSSSANAARMASTGGSMSKVSPCETRTDESSVGASCKRISMSESAQKVCSPERISFWK